MLSRLRARLSRRSNPGSAGEAPADDDPRHRRARELNRYAQNCLVRMLRGHHSHLPGDELSAQVVVYDCIEHPRAFLVELHLVVKPWPAHPGIRTAVAGVGRTAEAAVENGLRSWEEAILLPILFAVGRPAGTPDARLEATDGQVGTPRVWDVFLGPLQVAGDPATKKEVVARLDSETFWRLLREPLRSALGESALAWVKVFLARQQSGAITRECQLNNAGWPAGLTALSDFPWPRATGYISARQFIVLRASVVPPGAS